MSLGQDQRFSDDEFLSYMLKDEDWQKLPFWRKLYFSFVMKREPWSFEVERAKERLRRAEEDSNLWESSPELRMQSLQRLLDLRDQRC